MNLLANGNLNLFNVARRLDDIEVNLPSRFQEMPAVSVITIFTIHTCLVIRIQTQLIKVFF